MGKYLLAPETFAATHTCDYFPADLTWKFSRQADGWVHFQPNYGSCMKESCLPVAWAAQTRRQHMQILNANEITSAEQQIYEGDEGRLPGC